MRVFILCTGRCGSTTIIKACKHIDNFTSAHESNASVLGPERLDYPDNHIEADNRLSWHLGALNKRYGNKAFYVHLMRNRDDVAQSFLKRFYIPGSIIDSFCEGIRMIPPESLTEKERLQICYEYIDTVNSNIEHFLLDKKNVLVLNIESIQDRFAEFWNVIDAKGDLDKALLEFDNNYNLSSKRSLNLRHRLKLIVTRELRHLKMSLK